MPAIPVDERGIPAPWRKRYLSWPLSGALTWSAAALLSRLSLDRASDVGGAFARRVGPLTAISRRARHNLATSFPEWPDTRVDATLAAMWEHLGRVAGEYVHLRDFDLSGDDPRVTVCGREHLHAARDDGKPGIFVSAHVGNWELLPGVALANGLPVHSIYRPLNAPVSERVLRQQLLPHAHLMIPKGRAGAAKLARLLRQGEHVAFLVDQRLNEGLPVPFFGRPAKTTPAVAVFALHHRCPVIPIRAQRTGGAHFRITVSPPLPLPDSGDRDRDILQLTTDINLMVENWIREAPEQWLWPHRRWGKQSVPPS